MKQVVSHADDLLADRPAAEHSVNGSHGPGLLSAANFSDDRPALDAEQLLAQVRRNGLLPPQPSSPDTYPSINFATLLAQIRADGNGSALHPAPFVEPIESIDQSLDVQQADVVSRVLRMPDMLLVAGLPGTGKTRTIVEIIRQACRLGRRILLTGSASIDAIIDQVRSSTGASVLRILGTGETPGSLLPSSEAVTGPVQESALRGDWLAKARRNELAAAAACEQLSQAGPTWVRLLALADQLRLRSSKRCCLNERREAIAADVRQHKTSTDEPAGEQARQIEQADAAAVAEFQARQLELTKQRSRLEAEQALVRQEEERLRPIVTAFGGRRFWSIDYWRGALRPSLRRQFADCRDRIESIELEIAGLSQHEEFLLCQRRHAGQQNEMAWNEWIAGEIDRRVREIERAAAALEADEAAALEEFRGLVDSLPADGGKPECPEVDAVRSAQLLSEARLLERERETALARRWRESVDHEWDHVVRCWRSSVSLAAGPISALAADRRFADASSKPFDLLIVDDAHLLDEPELLAAARHAHRWVLMGDAAALGTWVPLDSTCADRTVDRRLRTNLFADLWELLDWQWWLEEPGRLCCRLHPVSPARRASLQTEPVADRPEFQLRIIESATGEPVLAEVVFPATFGRAAATEYIYGELGEAPCQLRLRSGRWVEHHDALLLRLDGRAAAPASGQHKDTTNPLLSDAAAPSCRLPPCTIELGGGVCLRLHESAAGPEHAEIVVVFDKIARWDRQRAEAWSAQHLFRRDPGRTCRLEKPYRHAPGLAAWLNEAIDTRVRFAVEPVSDGAVQFEPVPRLTPASSRRGGAGMEINLANHQQRELLPCELAQVLPRLGYVNLLEAQAIADVIGRLPKDLSVIATAPYIGQVMVLKHLHGDRVEVLSPAELAGRDCDILVISLTRSHLSRATIYGDDPAIMPGLFTRPSSRLILVGDPGTLARRARWQGAIDHWDAAAAERERRWVKAVLPLLQARSQVARPRARAQS